MNTDRYNALRLGFDPPPFQQKDRNEGDTTMQSEHSVKPDQDVLFAWREGLAEAAPSQDAKQQLLQREGELLPRFAAHYDDLTHLPRSMRRRLQRHWKRSLAGLALLLALGQTPVMAATINVGGACTLVRAIVAANNNTTATGHCKKGSGADLIVMPRNSTVTLTAANNNNPTYGPSGLPVIRSAITIDGNGSIVRRASNAPNFRIFAIEDGGDLRLQETTVSGGAAVSTPGVDDSGSGGGLSNYGKLTLVSCTVSGNRAAFGGGLFNYGALTIANSTVSGNRAISGGGMASSSYYSGNSLSVTNTTVSGNTASGRGGGIHNYGGVLTVTSSTISGNRAIARRGVSGSGGGGISNGSYGDARIRNSTISGNTTGGDGGGVYDGGIDAKVTLTNSTVTGNKAVGAGGGVNTYEYLDLNRTLVSGNTAALGREIAVEEAYAGHVTAADFNVFGLSGETKAQAFHYFTPSGTDITATSNGNRPTALSRILNTTLANNGGSNRTHALVAGSPAVDAVNDGTCPPPAKDQRGVRRPRDGNGDGGPACDVGSFER